VAEIAKRLHSSRSERARDPMRITIRSAQIDVHGRATRLGQRPHRSLRWSLPRHSRRFTNTWTLRRRKTVHANPVRLPPDIRNQIVELVANALVSDFRAYPTIPR
jgi:hypothetical protein